MTPGPIDPNARFHIVLNAGSGHQDTAERRASIERVLGDAGRSYEILAAERGRDIPSLAQKAVEGARQDGGVVVAAGGDGTINAVVQAVLGSGCVFGVLPQGTFNYFGRTHGIPSDTTEATRALLTSPVQPVQVGLVNDRVFLVNASLGLYPQLLEDREAYKQQYGRSRGVAFGAGLVSLMREHRQLRLRLERGGDSLSIRTPTLFVGNNRLQLEQIGIPEAPATEADQLVAITLKPVGMPQMLWLLVRGALGRLGEADKVVSFGFGRMTVKPALPYGRRRVKVATDGEIVRLRTPLVFAVSPEPLMLLKPAAPRPPTA